MFGLMPGGNSHHAERSTPTRTRPHLGCGKKERAVALFDIAPAYPTPAPKMGAGRGWGLTEERPSVFASLSGL